MRNWQWSMKPPNYVWFNLPFVKRSAKCIDLIAKAPQGQLGAVSETGVLLVNQFYSPILILPAFPVLGRINTESEV